MTTQDQKTSTTAAPRQMTSEEFNLLGIRRRLIQFESLLLLERLGHELSDEEEVVVSMVRTAMLRLDKVSATASGAVRSLATLVKIG